MHRATCFLLTVLIILSVWSFPAAAQSEPSDQNFYESLFQEHGAVMLLVDPDSGNIEFANNAAAEYYGYPVDVLQSMRISQINTLSQEQVQLELREAERENRNFFQFRHQLASGEIRDVEVYSYPVKVEDRSLLFSVVVDVSDRLAAETALITVQRNRLLLLGGGLLVLLVITAVLLALAFRHRRTLRALDRSNQFQKLIAEISGRFVDSTTEELDRLVQETLDRCGAFLGVDRAFVASCNERPVLRSRQYEWRAPGVHEPLPEMTLSPVQFPWLFQQMVANQVVCFSQVSELPESAAREKTIFNGQGIRSKIVLPILVNGEAAACLSLDTYSQPYRWNQDITDGLKVLAGILASGYERQQAEERRLFWQNLMQYTIENAPSSIAVFNKDLVYMYVSRQYLRDYRLDGQELVGRRHYDIFPEIPENWKAVHRRVLAGSIEQADEDAFVRQDGRIDYTRWLCRPWYDVDGQIGGMILYLEVINEWKKREIALKEGEERFRLLVETAPDAIFLYANRTLIYANTAAARLLRVESTAELIGQTVFTWVHPDYRAEVEARHSILTEERKAVPSMEQIYVRPDGSQLDVEVSAVPIRYNDQDCSLAYVRDISARKQQEQEKLSALIAHRQQQKLESIGTLASGVAHEINNPIMGIINYAQLIVDDHPSGEIADYARAILLEGNRISGITNDLLFYSRQQKQSHSPAKVEDIVNRTLSLVNHQFKKDQINLIVEIEANLPEVKCRSQQIQQVLMNLLTNARDALNERYPGHNPDKVATIQVSQYLDHGQPWVRLTVEDHGLGIPETAREQIFDPFFTTKSRDLGTGLGLPISYGIAQDHHGRLYFESDAGRTRFFLELPVDNGWNI